MKRMTPHLLLAAALSLFFFAGCAGSKGAVSGGDGDYSEDGKRSGGGKAKATSAQELDQASKEALKLENDNHKLRREIFDAKNKLGISTDSEE